MIKKKYNMKLTFKAEDFKMVAGNILIQPGPIKKIKAPSLEKTDMVEGGDPAKTKESKVVFEKEPTIIRIGKVLALPTLIGVNPLPHEVAVGDWVTYADGLWLKKLDLLAKNQGDVNCPVILRSHDIISIVDIKE